MLPGQREKLQIQPPEAKVPYSRVPVRAFEISTACLGIGRDIPAPTALISNKRELIMLRYFLHKGRISLNGLEPVLDRQSRAAQRGQSLRDGLLGRREMECV